MHAISFPGKLLKAVHILQHFHHMEGMLGVGTSGAQLFLRLTYLFATLQTFYQTLVGYKRIDNGKYKYHYQILVSQ